MHFYNIVVLLMVFDPEKFNTTPESHSTQISIQKRYHLITKQKLETLYSKCYLFLIRPFFDIRLHIMVFDDEKMKEAHISANDVTEGVQRKL